MWLPYDEKKIMIVRQTLWSDDDVDTVHVWQTDKLTDGQIYDD